MIANKISAANRKKFLAERDATTFIRWNMGRQLYEGVVEVYDSRSGEKYEFSGSQVEWMNLHKNMMESFAKDAHA